MTMVRIFDPIYRSEQGSSGNAGVISDVKFKTFGCGSAIASSSYMTERVKGMSLDQAGAIKNTEIAKELSLPPVKRASLTPISLGSPRSRSV